MRHGKSVAEQIGRYTEENKVVYRTLFLFYMSIFSQFCVFSSVVFEQVV